MNFTDNRSIFLQIYDTICEYILKGELKAEERVPSVREYAAEIGVNPNTVMRSYERLTNDNIIYNKRGIGYFVSNEAYEIVMGKMRKDFIINEVPAIIKKMELLDISPEIFSKS